MICAIDDIADGVMDSLSDEEAYTALRLYGEIASEPPRVQLGASGGAALRSLCWKHCAAVAAGG